jgi:SAM-dependent methyltransferase
VDALGPDFEGGYFLYRFSDPTFIIADAVVRAVAETVLDRGRALDICGGSGHLTRSLTALAPAPPLLADLYFAKLWLARRFTAPGCEAVCCDANAPFPVARGAFDLAVCSDAFQYIWPKRQFVGEMARAIGREGAVVISHTHNALAWSPSHGQPLDPSGYRDLFETIEPRIFGEARLFADVVAGGPLDLSRRDPPEALERDPALTIVATRHGGVFRPHSIEPPAALIGELVVNPLYSQERTGDRLQLRLSFPSRDYEEEYGACRRYLPEEATLDVAALEALRSGGRPRALNDLIRRKVILDLPKHYY